jgi:hypothetical protein
LGRAEVPDPAGDALLHQVLVQLQDQGERAGGHPRPEDRVYRVVDHAEGRPLAFRDGPKGVGGERDHRVHLPLLEPPPGVLRVVGRPHDVRALGEIVPVPLEEFGPRAPGFDHDEGARPQDATHVEAEAEGHHD